MLTVKDGWKQYKSHNVLQGVDVHIEAGDRFGVIGPNGSGKTTLLRLMSGEERPTHGTVTLGDRPIEHWRDKERAKHLTVVTQEGLAPVPFTVFDVVMMGRHVHRGKFHRPSSQDHEVVAQILTETGLIRFADKLVAHLSGGERQRVAIARALAQQPQILLLDEPTSYLDIGYQLSILTYVKAWQAKTGAAVVMVLHDLNLAAQFCEHLLLINEGRIVLKGEADDVLQPSVIQAVYQTSPVVISHPHLHVPQILLDHDKQDLTKTCRS